MKGDYLKNGVGRNKFAVRIVWSKTRSIEAQVSIKTPQTVDSDMNSVVVFATDKAIEETAVDPFHCEFVCEREFIQLLLVAV